MVVIWEPHSGIYSGWGSQDTGIIITIGLSQCMISQIITLILILFSHLFSIEQILLPKIKLKKTNWYNVIDKSTANC